VSIDGGEFSQMNASTDIATAERWTKALEFTEAKRLGVDMTEARASIARKLNVAPGTLEGIRRRRTKVVPSWLMSRICGAFVASLQMEIQRLEHEINIARQTGVDPRDDVLRAAETQVAKAKEILNASR
jgi:hypothetical protein